MRLQFGLLCWFYCCCRVGRETLWGETLSVSYEIKTMDRSGATDWSNQLPPSASFVVSFTSITNTWPVMPQETNLSKFVTGWTFSSYSSVWKGRGLESVTSVRYAWGTRTSVGRQSGCATTTTTTTTTTRVLTPLCCRFLRGISSWMSFIFECCTARLNLLLY